MDRLKKKIGLYWPALVLVLFFLSEASHKFFLDIYDFKILFTKLTKLVCIILFSFLIIYKSKKQILFLVGLLSVFIVGQSFISKSFETSAVMSLARFFVLIILLIFAKVYPLTIKSKHFVFKAFTTIMLVNSILIILGLAFDIRLFSTYTYRFGYNGLFVSSATSSYAYIIYFIYAYYKHKYASSFVETIQTFVIICSSILVGTKAIYLGLFLILGLAFVKTNRLSIQNKLTFISLSLIVAIGVFYYSFFYTGSFNSIREEKGLLSSILSFRNDLLIETTLPYVKENWSIWNFLFGGTSNFDTRTQMGFIDGFSF